MRKRWPEANYIQEKKQDFVCTVDVRLINLSARRDIHDKKS